jgi:thiamine-phosphate pyrophosphorylase
LLPARKKTIVCYVTDRRSLGAADASTSVRLRETIRLAIAAGADCVQIREKDLAGRELLGIVRDAVAIAKDAATAPAAIARVIMNGRLDVALAAGAGGVHLGGGSAPVQDVVAWCRRGNAPAGFSVGVSCHSLEDARTAERAGADYIFFGPVFDTPSKRAFGKAHGVVKLSEVCEAVRTLSVIAIGGIDTDNGGECMRAGSAGIAAIRLFQEASDLPALSGAIERLHRS